MKSNKVKVIVAFSNNLISTGICSLLDAKQAVEVTEVLKSGRTYSPKYFSSFKDNVILTDIQTLYNSFPSPQSVEKWPKIILLDTHCGRDNIIAAILKKKVCGVLNGNSDHEMLAKSIRTVADGEVWIDNKVIKNLIDGINSKGKRAPGVLTEREKDIVALTAKGFRNKEIAAKLHISEPTVKTHLCHIFQKLDIKTRSELIVYSLKHGEEGAHVTDKLAGSF